MTTFKEFEHSGWQQVAGRYHDAFAPVTGQSIQPLLNAVRAQRGVRLLDLACGPGYVAGAAAERGAEAIGIDFSSRMVEEARRRYRRVRFEEGDAEQLSFPTGEFDAVVMNFGMLHLSNPDMAIRESGRVLRAGGRFAFTVWDTPDKARGMGIILEAIRDHGDLSVSLPPGPPFFRFSDPEESVRALSTSGFSQASAVSVPQFWKLTTSSDLFDFFFNASVRNAALLRAQAPSSLDAIRTAVRDAVEGFRKGDHFELPMPAVLSIAVKD
jgi:ubiquinone/menaquinone biosynthesis C-methylase UbiE